MLLNLLSVAQSGFTALGVLMLLPLVNLAGLDMSQYSGDNHVLLALASWLDSQTWAKSLVGVLTIYALTICMIAFISYYRGQQAARLQLSYVKAVRNELYTSILESDWSYLSSKRASDYLHRVGSQVQAMNSSAHQLISLMYQLAGLAVFVVLMWILHWQFTLATLVVGTILALILLPIRWIVRDAGRRNLGHQQEIFSILAEHLINLKIIKASAREAQFIDEVDQVSSNLEYQNLRMTRSAGLVRLVNQIGLAIAFVALVYTGVVWFNMAIAEFMLLLVIMSRILPQLAVLQASMQGVYYTLPAFLDIEQTLRETSAHKEVIAAHAVEPIDSFDSIELRQVDFDYGNEGDVSAINFKQLNLKISRDKIVALKGESGSGKTTIADLFAGLSHAKSGGLYVDEMRVDRETRLRWRRTLAYVTQDVYLFNASFRQNLIWSAPEASEEDIWQALELAAIADKVRSSAKGLDTQIGDRGIRLSGGERQRIAIARALLTKSRFLILDEATSALDEGNESRIQQTIRHLKGRLTVLVIAHRQSTLEVADRIIDVDELVSSR